MTISTNAITKEHLIAGGWDAAIVQEWIKRPGKPGWRKDMLGWIDVLAFDTRHNVTLAIQTCEEKSAARNREKLCEAPWVKVWLGGGNPAELWVWCRLDDQWYVNRHPIKMNPHGVIEFSPPFTEARQHGKKAKGKGDKAAR